MSHPHVHAASPDDRYCIDNGAMIAWPGLLAFKCGDTTPLADATCTQRFRTDDVLVLWRGVGGGANGGSSAHPTEQQQQEEQQQPELPADGPEAKRRHTVEAVAAS